MEIFCKVLHNNLSYWTGAENWPCSATTQWWTCWILVPCFQKPPPNQSLWWYLGNLGLRKALGINWKRCFTELCNTLGRTPIRGECDPETFLAEANWPSEPGEENSVLTITGAVARSCNSGLSQPRRHRLTRGRTFEKHPFGNSRNTLERGTQRACNTYLSIWDHKTLRFLILIFNHRLMKLGHSGYVIPGHFYYYYLIVGKPNSLHQD